MDCDPWFIQLNFSAQWLLWRTSFQGSLIPLFFCFDVVTLDVFIPSGSNMFTVCKSSHRLCHHNKTGRFYIAAQAQAT